MESLSSQRLDSLLSPLFLKVLKIPRAEQQVFMTHYVVCLPY